MMIYHNSQSVLVDNSPHAYGFQIDNGIPIESWFDDDDDCELLSLLDFLDSMNAVEDVRPFIRDRFRTYKLVNKWRGTLRKLNKGVI
jgi:CTD small phosphatase-like protein 2